MCVCRLILRRRLQDKRKQEELLRVFEDNFLPDPSNPARQLPTFVQNAGGVPAGVCMCVCVCMRMCVTSESI
jgi:hypothetical protein